VRFEVIGISRISILFAYQMGMPNELKISLKFNITKAKIV
jgi:hypothetical protein